MPPGAPWVRVGTGGFPAAVGCSSCGTLSTGADVWCTSGLDRFPASAPALRPAGRDARVSGNRAGSQVASGPSQD